MAVEKQELYELMNRNPVFHLATIDGDQPRVRGMFLFRADQDGILFHTGAMKPLYRQVRETPNVELCFFDPKSNLQVRVSGSLEIVEDHALKDEIYDHPTRAFLKGWRENGALADFYQSFIVFRLKQGRATTWSMASNFDAPQPIQLD